jgi:hypothetical protein
LAGVEREASGSTVSTVKGGRISPRQMRNQAVLDILFFSRGTTMGLRFRNYCLRGRAGKLRFILP